MQLAFDLSDEEAPLDVTSPGRGAVLVYELSEGDSLRGQGGGEYVVSSDVPIGSASSEFSPVSEVVVYSGKAVASGMAVVFKVIDRTEIDVDPDVIKQLTRALNTARQLRHPNLVHLLDIVEWSGGGGTLADLILNGGPLPEQRARSMFDQIVSAVSYCHNRQVYHYHLTLEEVWIVSPGSDTLKIHGFGNAQTHGVEDVYAYHRPRRCSTLHYMSPEMAMVTREHSNERRRRQGATDIWSLGVMLYVLVCSTYPFGIEGPRRAGGIAAHKVYERIRRGKEAVQFPDNMSPELVELLKGIFTVPVYAPEDVPPQSARRADECPGSQMEPEPEPLARVSDSNECDGFRWSIERIRSCAWLLDGLEVAERRLALAKSASPQPLYPLFPSSACYFIAETTVCTAKQSSGFLRCIDVAVIRRGLDDRLAAGSLLLLLDVDVVRSIASTLDSPSVKRKMRARKELVDLPIVKIPPEIVWPERTVQQQEDVIPGLNTPVYELDTGATLQFGSLQRSVPSQLLGGQGALLADDTDGLALGLDNDDIDL